MTITREIKKATEIKEFHDLPNPNGEKTIKYPLENLYAVYLGTKDEIQEISICRKETDESDNTYYLDLLTKNKYSTSSNNENEVIVLKEFTLLGILKNINYRDKILENQYLTNKDLLALYDALNEDTKHEESEGYYNGAKMPMYCNRKTKSETIFFTNKDDRFNNLITTITTSNNIIVVTGKKGIGKSTLKERLFEVVNNKINPYLKCPYLIDIDFNEMIKNAITTKHIKNRIEKTLLFIKKACYSAPILFIDNVDFSNNYFIETLIKETEKENIKVILVSNKELNEDKLNKDNFSIINIKKPDNNTISEILRHHFTIHSSLNMRNDNPYPCLYNTNDIIKILLECDESHCMNQINNTQNPKLGITIIENAFKIAIITNSPYLTHEHFIKALSLDNIDMDKLAIEKATTEFEKLERKRLITIQNDNKKNFWIKYLDKKNEILPLMTSPGLIIYILLICDGSYNDEDNYTEDTILGTNIIDIAYNIAIEKGLQKVGANEFIEALDKIQINPENKKDAIEILIDQKNEEEKERTSQSQTQDTKQKKKIFNFRPKTKTEKK